MTRAGPTDPQAKPELRVDTRGLVRAAGEVGTQLTAFILSMGVLIGLLALLNYEPGKILSALWDGSAGSTLSLAISLNEATPLLLTATAMWVCVQAGIFNIGQDGQLQIGGLAAFVVVMKSGIPAHDYLVIPAGLVTAAVAGALWCGIAGAMKALRGANEIVSTLMLNFVAFITVDQIMRGPLQSEVNVFTPQTDAIPAELQIPPLVGGTSLTSGAILALAASMLAIVFITTTRMGLRLRAVGLNRDAARYAGVPIGRYWFWSMIGSGALAGLAGGLVILGLRYYIAPGWASTWGFTGILIAFLAFRSPFLIPVWALLFGMLSSAGPALKGAASVPESLVTIMQTLPVIILFLLYAGVRWARTGSPPGNRMMRQGRRTSDDAARGASAGA